MNFKKMFVVDIEKMFFGEFKKIFKDINQVFLVIKNKKNDTSISENKEIK